VLRRQATWPIESGCFTAFSTTVNGGDGCLLATIRDSSRDREESVPTDELLRRSGGILLLVERPTQNKQPGPPGPSPWQWQDRAANP
jgi:hypothetical protein